MKSSVKNTFVVGFAVFAMLFGAGNLIFPPFLGMHSGTNWIIGFAGFAFMDVILSMIVLNLVQHKEGGTDGIVGILGKRLSVVLMLAMYICIGPLVAIPRTAATTYELTCEPLLPGINSVVFSIVFFAIVLVLTIRPSKIIDIIGSVLAPILLITLGVLIIKGVVNPLGTIGVGDSVYESVHSGVTTGYQTMDIIAGMAFSIVIIAQIRDYKLEDRKAEGKMMKGACLIAGVALTLVYGGLAYLGATVSKIYPADFGRADILLKLSEDILGPAGKVVLGVIVAAACLTTAIGLVSSCAAYFEKVSGGKVSYKLSCIVICIFSAFICNIGLDNIIKLASPILDLIYPILLVLIILAFVKESVLGRTGRIGAVVGTAAFVVIHLVESISDLKEITAMLPLASLGFAWVLPAVIGLCVGVVVGKFVNEKNTVTYNI
ncbi:MAG: branched-chain amino acid transport system II carrier protein [Lachnospiraceae bacterium]|nr:branched-chain amino acid transport system II carrier protein [Lachnospiraceae bacterium]